jgi:hypothetical protein
MAAPLRGDPITEVVTTSLGAVVGSRSIRVGRHADVRLGGVNLNGNFEIRILCQNT